MATLVEHQAIDSFLQQTERAFQSDEVGNNLIYGVADRVLRQPDRYARVFMATVHDGPALTAAALMTDPHNLIVFSATDDPTVAFQLTAQRLVDHGWRVPGVVGPTPTAKAYAEVWSETTGQGWEISREMRAFKLTTVKPPRCASGRLRPATGTDFELVYAWYTDFTLEALPEQQAPDPAGVRRALAAGDIYLWEDGSVVSLAAQGRRTKHGASIGPVYTPPSLRGRGYASACVAALSQHLLDAGWSFCTLFTDLANPTSNSIYQKLGFRPECDFSEMSFAQ